MIRHNILLFLALTMILAVGYHTAQTAPYIGPKNTNNSKTETLSKNLKITSNVLVPSSQNITKYLTITGSSNVTALTYSPDGSIIVIGYKDGWIDVWNLTSASKITSFHDHTGKVTSIIFRPATALFGTAGVDGNIVLHNPLLGLNMTTIPLGVSITGLAYAPDGSKLYVGLGNGTLHAIYTADYSPLYNIAVSSSNITAVGSSTNIIYTADNIGNISLWYPSNGSLFNTIVSGVSIKSMIINSANSELITENAYGIVQTWNQTDLINSANTNLFSDVQPISLNTHDELLATAEASNFTMWEYSNSNIQIANKISINDHTANVTAIEFAPNNMTITVGSDDNNITVYLFHTDSDNDGIPDVYELGHGLNPLINDANNDNDGDYMSNLLEYQLGYDANNSADGRLDLDQDGMSNSCEARYGLDLTNPADALLDSDSDGMPNLYECQTNLDPIVNDAALDGDLDGMPNLWEYQMGLNASINDAALDHDNDGMPNLWEYQMGLNATFDDSQLDHDGDSMPNLYEYQHGLNANFDDYNLDLDGDGMPNGWEFTNHLNPSDPTDANKDPDGDGATNLQEYLAGTNPHFNEKLVVQVEAFFGILVGLFIMSFFVEVVYKQIKEPKNQNRKINRNNGLK